MDLHSQISGAAYPLYISVDYRLNDAVQMARLVCQGGILNLDKIEGLVTKIP